MNVRHLALIVVAVSVVALACASPPPDPPRPSSQPRGCTAEDMYGSEAMLAECTRNLHTLTAAVAEFSARNGGRVPLHLGELGRVPRTCGANRGQDYELRSVDGKTVVICPGTSHSSLGLPTDFPQQAVGGALLLHPALKLRPGPLGLGGVRPGLTAEGLLETLGPPLNTGRPPHIRQYSGDLHVAYLDRDGGAVGLVQGTALTGQDGRPYLVIGDSEELVRQLLGTPRKVGEMGQFPPQGQEYEVDGLRLHLELLDGHVSRLALALPGYRPDWALWRR